ncbi:acyltransferase family protein [Pseudoduganella namucuonensis]|uniref:Fucose 4-O-acetylase n=1 Tax=Pseudoduganella namucuonensis TaxID=1035707 RepID=A0A1I7JU61_9BURK|nr:acyltransferase family protein [Pseudoduganella namucuonensis]SFU88751.1 Fucose 4-O-acetylase [Pseudoduganella namucuonensis]
MNDLAQGLAVGPGAVAAPVAASLAETGRMAWVDIVKAAGIFLIVFGHLPVEPLVAKFLWTFHVPLFFFLSGYLSRPAGARAFARRLSLRLVLPYFVAYALLTLIMLRTLDWGVLRPVLTGAFHGTHSYPGFISAPLWFVPALVVVELLYFAFQRRLWALYPVALGVSLWLYHNGKIDLFMSVDLALLGLNYFLLGALARSTGVVDRLARVPLAAALLAGLGLAVVVDLALAGNVWYTGGAYMRSVLGGVAGIAMMIAFALNVRESPLLRNRAVRFVSENTLFILCFHGVSNGYAHAFVSRFAIEGTLLKSGLAAALSILLLVPFAMLFRRWAPWAIGAAPSARRAAV